MNRSVDSLAMLRKRIGDVALVSLVLFFFGSIGFAVVVHETVRYERPVREIRGRVTGFGQVMRVVYVDVYDNAQACLDHSLSPVEKRKRQTQIASVEADANGQFNIRHLPKGFYEVEFGNHGNGGYNIMSVLVNVDPKGTKDKLCVDLSLESAGGKTTVAECSAKWLLGYRLITH